MPGPAYHVYEASTETSVAWRMARGPSFLQGCTASSVCGLERDSWVQLPGLMTLTPFPSKLLTPLCLMLSLL